MQLDSVFRYLDLLDAFQKVDRRVTRRGEDRFENDAEHSYQLAMTAWYLNEADSLGMDTGLILRFALAHDLVEAHAGDTPAFTTDQAERDTKDAREAAAAARLREEFPEFPVLHGTIATYEHRDSREARFVYALDKLLPIINSYLDEGRTWHRERVTFAMMRAYKADKIAESPEANAYFQELLALLEEQPGLFPKPLAD